MSLVDGYPEAGTLYIGLLLVDDRFKRQSVGSQIIKGVSSYAKQMKYKDLRLSVQENNIAGLRFWRKMGFYEIDRCECDGFDNLSMKYDIC